jgi:hypothetical protein
MTILPFIPAAALVLLALRDMTAGRAARTHTTKGGAND